MQILQVFLPLKEPLVASLNETCALTSETNVAKKGMTIPELSKTIRIWERESTTFTKVFLEVCAHFLLKIATKDYFKYKKVKKLLFVTLKLYKQEQRSAAKLILFF